MILLALGSNMGDRAANLAQARGMLTLQEVHIVASSSIHETPALLSEGAPKEWNTPFLNQVLLVETEKAPLALLACLQQIELALGRRPAGRWAPRRMDIDILDHHGKILAEETLTLPHPQLHHRAFVLAPLAEVAPEWLHPILRKTPLEMLAMFPV